MSFFRGRTSNRSRVVLGLVAGSLAGGPGLFTGCTADRPNNPPTPATEKVGAAASAVTSTCTPLTYDMPCDPQISGLTACQGICRLNAQDMMVCVPIMSVGLNPADLNGRLCGPGVLNNCSMTGPVCDGGSCVHNATMKNVQDGTACQPTVNDSLCAGQCLSGVCTPVTNPCPYGQGAPGANSCTFQTCLLTQSVQCHTINLNAGAGCDDLNNCTSMDQCDATGQCVGLPVLGCTMTSSSGTASTGSSMTSGSASTGSGTGGASGTGSGSGTGGASGTGTGSGTGGAGSTGTGTASTGSMSTGTGTGGAGSTGTGTASTGSMSTGTGTASTGSMSTGTGTASTGSMSTGTGTASTGSMSTGTGTGTASTGQGGSSSGTSVGGASATALPRGGCSCEVASESNPTSFALGALGVVVAVGRRRRRRLTSNRG